MLPFQQTAPSVLFVLVAFTAVLLLPSVVFTAELLFELLFQRHHPLLLGSIPTASGTASACVMQMIVLKLLLTT
jgi:hypothetical protein